jgi:excisionase family DNA binding protein
MFCLFTHIFMNLTLTQTAELLGKTRRQVEYLIKSGRLRAQKQGGRWVVKEADLPLSPGQRQARARKAAALRDAADEALSRAAPKQRYSMRDLKAFQEAAAAFNSCRERVDDTHRALQMLHDTLDDLAIGYHRYDRRGKAEAYGRARDRASLAACTLLVQGPPETEDIVERIEQALIPAISGLMRRTDKQDTSR